MVNPILSIQLLISEFEHSCNDFTPNIPRKIEEIDKNVNSVLNKIDILKPDEINELKNQENKKVNIRDYLQNKITSINKIIWDKTSWTGKITWYLKNWIFGVSSIQFVSTKKFEEYNRLEKLKNKLSDNLDNRLVVVADDTHLKDRMNKIVSTLDSTAIGTSAISLSRDTKKINVFTIDQDKNIRENSFVITKKGFEGDGKKYNTLQELINTRISLPIEPCSVAAKERQVELVLHIQRKYCESYITPRNDAEAEKLLKEIKDKSKKYFLIIKDDQNKNTFTIYSIINGHVDNRKLTIHPDGKFAINDTMHGGKDFDTIISNDFGLFAPHTLSQQTQSEVDRYLTPRKNFTTIEEARDQLLLAIKTMHDQYPITDTLPLFSAFSVENSNYIAIRNTAGFLQYYLVDFTSKPGQICYKDPDHPDQILHIYLPDELVDSYKKQDFTSIDVHTKNENREYLYDKSIIKYQNNNNFYEKFQNSIYTLEELYKDASIKDMSLLIREFSTKMLSLPNIHSHSIVSTHADPKQAEFFLFTQKKPYRILSSLSGPPPITVQKILIQENGSLILQKINSDNEPIADPKNMTIDELNTYINENFKENLKNTITEKLEQLSSNITKAKKKIQQLKSDFRKYATTFPVEYNKTKLRSIVQEIRKIKTSIDTLYSDSYLLWEEHHPFIDELDLEIKTIKLRIKIHNKLQKFSEKSDNIKDFDTLSKLELEITPILEEARNSVTSNMSLDEIGRIFDTYKEICAQCATRLFPEYVKTQIPQLIDEVNKKCHDCIDANELDRQYNTVQSTLTMLQEALDFFFNETGQLAIVRDKVKQLTVLLSEIDKLKQTLPQRRAELEDPKKRDNGPVHQHIGDMNLGAGAIAVPVAGHHNIITINVGQGLTGTPQESVAKTVNAVSSSLFNPFNLIIKAAQFYLTYQTFGAYTAAATFIQGAASTVTEVIAKKMPDKISPESASKVSQVLQLGSLILFNKYGKGYLDAISTTQPTQEFTNAMPAREPIVVQPIQPRKKHVTLKEKEAIRRAQENEKILDLSSGNFSLTPNSTPSTLMSSSSSSTTSARPNAFSQAERDESSAFIEDTRLQAARVGLTVGAVGLTGLTSMAVAGPATTIATAGTLLGRMTNSPYLESIGQVIGSAITHQQQQAIIAQQAALVQQAAQPVFLPPVVVPQPSYMVSGIGGGRSGTSSAIAPPPIVTNRHHGSTLPRKIIQ